MADPVSSTSPSYPSLSNGRSLLGFSLSSPDLVVCAGSPEMASNICGVSPEICGRKKHCMDLSLDNGIAGFESGARETSRSVKFSPFCQTFYNKESSPESSIELLARPVKGEQILGNILPAPGIGINVGYTDDQTVAKDSLNYMKDNCFLGGDTVSTNAIIGDGLDDDSLSLYQTARMGNFSYCFRSLEPGDYNVALHFAEIVFTNGPPGLRVFDVFLQDKKVVSSLDIFARVGANNPLVISDLKAYVGYGENLSIRFEGVTGTPILCALSIAKDDSAISLFHKGTGESSFPKHIKGSQAAECETQKNVDCEMEDDYQKLLSAYECQQRELTEMRKTIEELNRENHVKTKECQNAWKSLQDLQSELMRKSMHVGSLAFAVEGQVKEKSRWFSALKDLSEKLQIMKGDQIKLSEEARSYKACFEEMNEIAYTIQSTIKEQAGLHGDLMKKFMEGVRERKELYNKVLELKGNIRVFCRCRPLNHEEVEAGASMAIDFESAKAGELTVFSNGVPKKTFKFDSIFSPQANQADVFEDTAAFATSVLDGYNVCIFAYGQTGTGKTFTMEGTKEARGVNYRTLDELFRIINEREKHFKYEVTVSVLEVYNEQIRDLLVPSSQASTALEIRPAGDGLHCVQGLVEARVNNVNEAWEVLQTGTNARAVSSTCANDQSSRSHWENLLNKECTRSKLWLVDLAGSERVAKTEVQGERLKETQNINRSLSALGDVIFSLATKSPHIPFRNSKLTHLLQDSLGGDSKALMFVQISPNESDLNETLCSLNFASRVRGIELGPAKRQLDMPELVKYKQLAEKTRQELKLKDVQIRKMDDTVHGLELKVKEKDIKNKHLQEKIKELESQLLVERKLARQHVDTKIAEQQIHQQSKQSDDQSCPPPRPPLGTRLLGNKASTGFANDVMENYNHKPMEFLPSTDVILNITDSMEKENNPDMAENLGLPKRTGRFSICPTGKQIPASPAPRRNSLIPFPSVGTLSQHPPAYPSPLPSLPVFLNEDAEKGGYETATTTTMPNQNHCYSPKEGKTGTRKRNSALRRSLHKKVQNRSPMQQIARKGGINVGMEKVRLSIGSRGRMAQRVVLHGSAAKRVGGSKETQQKQVSKKEKERGWNSGTTARCGI
ncbi:Kinesin-like protein KIN-14Q [Linum perenne]